MKFSSESLTKYNSSTHADSRHLLRAKPQAGHRHTKVQVEMTAASTASRGRVMCNSSVRKY